MTVLTQAGLALATYIPKLVGAADLGRIRPTPKSTKYAERKLDKAFDKHVDDIKPGKKVDLEYVEAVPKSVNQVDAYLEALNDSNQFAGSTVVGRKPGVRINPNADRVYYAHELGHLAAQQTDVGRFVNEMRQNPKLAQAAGIALMTIPGVAAAIEEGDNDLDTSIALAALTSAPVLADEALASINAQQIMDKAQLRTSLGQRGKLAGGLLSYLAAPVIAGAAGNMVGNMLD